jgi:hypothetical protein
MGKVMLTAPALCYYNMHFINCLVHGRGTMHPNVDVLRYKQRIMLCFSLLAAMTLSSCSSLLTGMIEPTVGNLQKQTDLDLVCEGAPAYLLMIDSMIASAPDNNTLLLIGAKSYSAYTAAMKECGAKQDRISAITEKARLYGTSLLTRLLPVAPGDSLEALDTSLQDKGKSDVPELFWGALAWTTWIQNQQGSPASLADAVKVEKIMLRLEQLDDTFEHGTIHLFLGGYYAAKPQLFGGRPDLSRLHFEKALTISQHRFLLVQTTYAQTYARLTMDKQLHDTLLRETLDFPLEKSSEFALSNQIAKRKAKKLLAEEFFKE